MILQEFILQKERILKNKYKKVKLLSYIDVNIVDGVIHEPFINKNTNLSVKGNGLNFNNIENVNSGATMVLFECKTNKGEVGEKFIFIKE